MAKSISERIDDILLLTQFDLGGAEYFFEHRPSYSPGSSDGALLWAKYEDADVYTGKYEWQTTRKWYISSHATDSEILQTILKLCLTSAEHRVRESFLYGGKRIFGPHIKIDAHMLACDNVDHREDNRSKKPGAP